MFVYDTDHESIRMVHTWPAGQKFILVEFFYDGEVGGHHRRGVADVEPDEGAVLFNLRDKKSIVKPAMLIWCQ